MAGEGAGAARDEFQIICYENNNIAFFAETVVLVEGDSDYIVFPHLGATIDRRWDCALVPIRFARIGGKSNIRRYTKFFQRFNMRVCVITDLDFLLGNEYAQIDPSPELIDIRQRLLASLDKAMDAAGGLPEPSAGKVKDAHAKGDLRGLWRRARELQTDFKNKRATIDQVAEAVDEFFAWEKYWGRRDLLREAPNGEVRDLKMELLTKLRRRDICVLEKGALDDYYPDGITGDGKPAKAQCFCSKVTNKAHAVALCNAGHAAHDGASVSEFEAIFGTVFRA